MSDEDCPKNDPKCEADEASCREAGIGFECEHEVAESSSVRASVSADYGYDNEDD